MALSIFETQDVDEEDETEPEPVESKEENGNEVVMEEDLHRTEENGNELIMEEDLHKEEEASREGGGGDDIACMVENILADLSWKLSSQALKVRINFTFLYLHPFDHSPGAQKNHGRSFRRDSRKDLPNRPSEAPKAKECRGSDMILQVIIGAFPDSM